MTFVAQLDALMSRLGLLVTPFVGIVSPTFVPKLDPNEVSAAFRVPLDLFLSIDPAVHTAVLWEEEDGNDQLSHMFATPEGHTVWGLTASLILHLLVVSEYAPVPYDVSLPGSLSWLDKTLAYGPNGERPSVARL